MTTEYENPVWYVNAAYADGYEIETTFPYAENGNYRLECERQQDLEQWALEQHEDCLFYSVGVCEA